MKLSSYILKNDNIINDILSTPNILCKTISIDSNPVIIDIHQLVNNELNITLNNLAVTNEQIKNYDTDKELYDLNCYKLYYEKQIIELNETLKQPNENICIIFKNSLNYNTLVNDIILYDDIYVLLYYNNIETYIIKNSVFNFYELKTLFFPRCL